MNKILIIEDEKMVAELEKDYLELSDFEVTIAKTGEEGLNLLEDGGFDLIILDLVLPDMDGFEICHQIRKKMDNPIILVSSKSEDIDKIRGLGTGADDYVTKPFSPSELVARVKAHLNRFQRLTRKNRLTSEVTNVGELRIDRTARRVFVDGEERSFTSREFELLYFLANNPNRVFTKDELFQEIWGQSSAGDVATVTVHVKKIREKVESDPANPKHIETIWGIGYRFMP